MTSNTARPIHCCGIHCLEHYSVCVPMIDTYGCLFLCADNANKGQISVNWDEAYPDTAFEMTLGSRSIEPNITNFHHTRCGNYRMTMRFDSALGDKVTAWSVLMNARGKILKKSPCDIPARTETPIYRPEW